jgi:hypothetical protein
VTLFLTGAASKGLPAWIFFALWVAHYTNRSLIFPWRTQTGGKSIPVLIVAWAILFNIVNGTLNGIELGSRIVYPDAWLSDVRFLSGLLVFLTGAAINLWADNRLIGMRSGNATGYSIPRGGLFDLVSCPNLLGEVVQWSGFALMCWNLPALSFAVWTASNLIPRALSHHAWYRVRFADYPRARRAVIPFLL